MAIPNYESKVKSWVGLYSDKMYSWAFHKTNNKETSEDLVQDTFLAAFNSIQKFEGKSEPKTWLFAILNNKIAEHFRKVYRNPGSLGNEGFNVNVIGIFFDKNDSWLREERPQSWSDAQIHFLDDHDFNDVLENCMNKLPANWYAALQLKYIEEKKGDLICQELDITATNFWQILHRAKLQLRKCLDVNWFNK